MKDFSKEASELIKNIRCIYYSGWTDPKTGIRIDSKEEDMAMLASVLNTAYMDGRLKGLEEAAKVADNYYCGINPSRLNPNGKAGPFGRWIADQIRELASKEAKECLRKIEGEKL